jgi:hypothetical protein
MSLEQQLYSSLVADIGVSALIGARFYGLQLPQGPDGLVFPAGVYQRVSTVPLYTHTRGRSPLEGGQATVGRARMALKFWSDSASGYAVCLQIYEAVMAAMENFNAIALPTSPAIIAQAPNRLLSAIFDDESNTQPPLSRLRMDFEIWYQDQ